MGVYHSTVIVHFVMSFLLGAIFRHILPSAKVDAEPKKQCTGGILKLASFFWLQTGALLNLSSNHCPGTIPEELRPS